MVGTHRDKEGECTTTNILLIMLLQATDNVYFHEQFLFEQTKNIYPIFTSNVYENHLVLVVGYQSCCLTGRFVNSLRLEVWFENLGKLLGIDFWSHSHLHTTTKKLRTSSLLNYPGTSVSNLLSPQINRGRPIPSTK